MILIWTTFSRKKQDKLIRNGNASAIFEVKERLLSNKKESDECSAIISPKTGATVFNPSEIVEKMVKLFNTCSQIGEHPMNMNII